MTISISPDFSKYVGIPFVPHGRSLKGADCWGLFCLVQREVFGRVLPDYAYRSTTDRVICQHLEKVTESEWEKVAEPEPGDGVLIRVREYPYHVGVYVGQHALLHTCSLTGSVIHRIDHGRIGNRILGYYRHAG